tara:strand:- start:206 stop:1018 length:813 start_codon:yes stop_codon:yes gene_type:complete
MNEIIQFLKENSDWLKDVSTMIFAGTGTIIGILSYKKAKSSIFQPKRTEVTKIQTDILLEFLKKYTTNGNSIDQAIDYRSILSYNIELLLRDYNLVKIEEKSKKYSILSNSIAGWYRDPGSIDNVNVEEGSIEEYDKFYFYPKSLVELEKGEVYLDRIFFTTKHFEFIKSLSDLSSNPFLNKEIQQAANRIGKNLTINIQEKVKKVLENQAIEIYKVEKQEKSVKNTILNRDIKYAVMLSIFELDRIDHTNDYDHLIKEIRTHLMIDEKW